MNVTVSWYHAVLHKRKPSRSRSHWKTGKLKVLKKMMLRAVYAVCNVLLSLTSFPLPTHLAGLHLEVSSVPCAAASFVTWTLKGFLKCGKQIAEDTAGN